MSGHLEVTILGSGSSGGVPRIGGADGHGDWGACDPNDPKNRRRRCSILVRKHAPGGETAILVDTAPDMREQLIDARVRHLDAVLITHDHADQLHGIDDLRVLVLTMRKRIDLYADHLTQAGIMRRFGYIFERPESSDYPPILNMHTIEEPFSQFDIAGAGGPVSVLPFEQEHGRIRSLGFRFGDFAYSSDVSGLDEAAFAAFRFANEARYLQRVHTLAAEARSRDTALSLDAAVDRVNEPRNHPLWPFQVAFMLLNLPALADPAHPDRVAVGIDINATHHRSATSGTVTGVATPIHLGRTSACFEVVITDERGKVMHLEHPARRALEIEEAASGQGALDGGDEIGASEIGTNGPLTPPLFPSEGEREKLSCAGGRLSLFRAHSDWR